MWLENVYRQEEGFITYPLPHLDLLLFAYEPPKK